MSNNQDQVILVDANDNPVGVSDKIPAHQNGGILHRAFSIFIRDDRGRWMLQRRAAGKYHFPMLWTNTCCSHPRPGETTAAAAHRRLREEMGFDCPLTELFQFTYRAACSEGLTEHEFDHVLTGTYNGPVQPNPEEVAEWRWITLDDLKAEVDTTPGHFTPWFKIAFREFVARAH